MANLSPNDHTANMTRRPLLPKGILTLIYHIPGHAAIHSIITNALFSPPRYTPKLNPASP